MLFKSILLTYRCVFLLYSVPYHKHRVTLCSLALRPFYLSSYLIRPFLSSILYSTHLVLHLSLIAERIPPLCHHLRLFQVCSLHFVQDQIEWYFYAIKLMLFITFLIHQCRFKSQRRRFISLRVWKGGEISSYL